jgi:two-component system, OmpR family, alkaline phosphatase synthesis response regulator PhoP
MSETAQRILVIDDEPHITHVVALKLRHAGFEVFTAGDGEEGYELACEREPDLIITDLWMPYMTGLEMCKKLSGNPRTASIPVIVLTARGYALDPEDVARTSVRLMMSKPFGPRELLQRVNEILSPDEADLPKRARDAA